MALQITSANTLSSTSSFGYFDNFPKPPSSVHMRPLKSSFIQSLNNLLPLLNSYLPMPNPEIDHKYTPVNPLYLPWRQPHPPYQLGEDMYIKGRSRDTIHRNHSTRPNTHLHLITSRWHIISLLATLPLDDVIDPEMCNVLMRCMRVGRAVWLLWKEIILLFKACNDDNDNEETFGEYVKSTKQLKKIRRQEMLKRRIPWKWQPRCFSPWYWWIFLQLIVLWLNRHSFMTHSSNSGTMTQLIHHPLSPYILSFTWWVNCPPLLSSIFTLMTPFPVLHHHFSMAVLLCLLRLHIMTHFWLIFDSHYSPCW